MGQKFKNNSSEKKANIMPIKSQWDKKKKRAINEGYLRVASGNYQKTFASLQS